MEIILFYLLRASTAAAILYMGYKLLLSKNTFHGYNRVLVLFFFVCSLAFPLMSVDMSWLMPPKPEPAALDLSQFTVTETVPVAVVTATVIPWFKILTATYFTGMIVTLLVFWVSLARMFYVILKSERRKLENGVTLCISAEDVSPFSWMRFLVISREDFMSDNFSIIEHEKAHIQRHHSWDMLFTNIYAVIFWFNPFAWLLRRELQTIHEYQADEKVIATGTDIKQYQLLLIRKCVGENKFMLANNFEYSHLQKRIKMIMKTPTKNRKRWIYSITPLFLALTIPVLSLEPLHAKTPAPPQDTNKITETTAEKTKKTSDYEIVVVDGKAVVAEKKDSKGNTPPTLTSQLKGDVQGITVASQENGKEPTVTTIKIRKDTTKLAGNPLFIVDGKEAENIQNIKSGDIESINVLKGESATKIYGEKGKNGVVIITLKGSEKQSMIISAKEMSEKDLKQNPLKLGKSTVVPMSENVLYILDGKEISAKDMKEIKPTTIENITVLKDKSAIELYGEKGKNGVILITTKSNKNHLPTDKEWENAAKKTSKSVVQLKGELINVTGSVVDENTKPIVGAALVVDGTQNGTVTDDNGKFSIKLNKGEKIKVIMFNKATVTLKVDQSSDNVKIILKSNK